MTYLGRAFLLWRWARGRGLDKMGDLMAQFGGWVRVQYRHGVPGSPYRSHPGLYAKGPLTAKLTVEAIAIQSVAYPGKNNFVPALRPGDDRAGRYPGKERERTARRRRVRGPRAACQGMFEKSNGTAKAKGDVTPGLADLPD